MSDLQSAVQRMLDQLDSPVLKLAREVQEKMDALQSPGLRAMLESNRKMQELISPAARSILASQEHLRLAVNPNIRALLDQQEKVNAALKPYQKELSGNMLNLSKWAASIETPASVFAQIGTFKKQFYNAAMPIAQGHQYIGYFDRIHKYTSLTSQVPMASLDLDLFRRFEYTLIGDEDDEPESQIILLDEGSRVKRIITDIYHNHQGIFTMQPADFEDMIAELLRFQQFEVEMTKRTRDGGYDLIAVKNIGDFPVRFLVECKRHASSRKIGVGIVRSFRDVINTNGANKGIIVTSSYFSPDAEKERLKNKPYMLDFKDHDDVIEWVNKYVN